MASSLPQAHSEIEMENQCYSTTDASSAASCSFTVNADPITSTSTSAGDYGYDVFINHRGEDTKKTFASYLYRRLLLHGLRPFLDQQELQGGRYFPSQIRGAIRSASIHVAVFSPKYAESQWCLEELLLMRESGASIIPVFYHVKPADLRWNNKGVYAEALQQLERKKTDDSQTDQEKPRYESATIQNWRDALSSVADISGFDLDGALFNGDEGHMLDKLVERVVEMAKNTRLYVAKSPTGLEEKVEDFETTILRQRHTGKAQVVGMVGFGGVGKTTLANEFFNRKRYEYSRSCFLSDLRERRKEENKQEEKKDEQKEEKLEEGSLQIFELKVDMHCEGCARKVKTALTGFQGVEDVEMDITSHRVIVKGKSMDPARICERVQKKSGGKTELMSPFPNKESEENKPAEGAELPVVTVVLQVHMHGERYAEKVTKSIMKMAGVQSAEADLEEQKVTVKGAIDPLIMVNQLYKRTGKHAQIVAQEKEEENKPGDGDNKDGEKADDKKDGDDDAKKGEGNGNGSGEGERKINESYAPKYVIEYIHPPQIFSDENPNSCSIL